MMNKFIEVVQKYLKNFLGSHSYSGHKAEVLEPKVRRRLAMSNYLTDDCSHQKNQPVYSLPKKHDFCLPTNDDDDDDGCS